MIVLKNGSRKGATARRVSHLRCGFRYLAFSLGLLSSAWAGDAANDAAWRVWLESKAMHAPVTAPIPQAARTALAAGFLADDGMTYCTAPEFASMKLEWARFAERARLNAAADLRSLTPRFERNGWKVIEFAELTSERPIVASAVLAPTLLALFKDTLGEKVLLVVPNRFTAYVFPAQASNYQDYTPMVLEAFRATAWPVSTEIFEVSAAGMRAIGVYEAP